MRYRPQIFTKYAFRMYLSHTIRTQFEKYFWIFYDQITTERTDICTFKKSVFCPYLGQFLSDFENLWYHYNQKNEIFKLSAYTHWSDRYLKKRFFGQIPQASDPRRGHVSSIDMQNLLNINFTGIHVFDYLFSVKLYEKWNQDDISRTILKILYS